MWNPLSWAMEAAAILAIALLDYADFALIVSAGPLSLPASQLLHIAFNGRATPGPTRPLCAIVSEHGAPAWLEGLLGFAQEGWVRGLQQGHCQAAPHRKRGRLFLQLLFLLTHAHLRPFSPRALTPCPARPAPNPPPGGAAAGQLHHLLC